MRRRLTVLTVGCKVNFADSAALAAAGAEAGFDLVSPREPADVIIVNSCSVTHRADRDSRALVRRARRRCPRATIVLTGCYAETTRREEVRLPEADHWIGTGDAAGLRNLLRDIRGGGGGGHSASLTDFAADMALGRRRTFLKVQDGCDAVCAYCIVPRARGKGRSAPEEEILRRAARAEEDGARELVLAGVHVGLYGADRGDAGGLARLVRRLLRATSRARFRLSSVEPGEVTDRLLDVIGEDERVCAHLHVPLQSGCDRTLARMRRPYGVREYADAVGRAVRRVPCLQVGTDVIAGFPGETPGDFEQTLRFLGEVPVHYLHVFPYSVRHGTESAGWPDDVGAKEKKERVRKLRRMDGIKREAFAGDQVGRELSVLAETVHRGRGEVSGRSGNYVTVFFPGDGSEVGEIHRVRAVAVRKPGVAGRREERDA